MRYVRFTIIEEAALETNTLGFPINAGGSARGERNGHNKSSRRGNERGTGSEYGESCEPQRYRYGVVKTDETGKERVFLIEGDIFGSHEITSESYEVSAVQLLAPCEPTKVVCIGLNYRDHAQELGKDLPSEPVIFLKPPTSVIGHDHDILYPPLTKELHYEAELAVVIGKRAKGVPKSKALDYVFGYTAGNDVTARDLQNRDGQWTRSKSFDTFCPLGPWIETEVVDPGNLDISLRLNGKVKQKSNTANLLFGVPRLIEYITQVMTLLPGDVILTGTPGGIGPMCVGDVVEVTVGGVGTLRNRVARARRF